MKENPENFTLPASHSPSPKRPLHLQGSSSGVRAFLSPEIRLSEKDNLFLLNLAHGRNDPKIGVVRNRRVDQKRSDIRLNFGGIKGEFAVAKFLDINIDESISLSGDGGVFDLIYDGKKIQVKFNNTLDGDLYFNQLSEFRADIAILTVSADGIIIRVVGWIDRENFESSYKIKNWGYGNRFCVSQKKLFPMSFLRPQEEILPSLEDLSWCFEICRLTEGQSKLCEVRKPCPRYRNKKEERNE